MSEPKRVFRTTLVTLGNADKCTLEEFLTDAHANFKKWLYEHPADQLAYELLEMGEDGEVKQTAK